MRRITRRVVDAALGQIGYAIVRQEDLYDWQHGGPGSAQSRLPSGFDELLVPDHPRLVELQQRYTKVDQVTEALVWGPGHVSARDLRRFRGETAYVWQLRGQNMNEPCYALSAYYARTIDTLDLLGILDEDGLFGAITFEVNGQVISRDLLDSVFELTFLEQTLGISKQPTVKILDIGAGYGRLAHRASEALPNMGVYLCTDAYPASTFLSEVYLGFREAQHTEVVPLDEIDQRLETEEIDLAINVHSFSECTPQAIVWWMALLQRHRVPKLMIVPNALDHGGTRLLTNDGVDFAPIVAAHGYQLKVQQPKYADPIVQKYGINPTCHYLFELT